MSFLETQCAKFAEALFAKGRQVDGSADGQQRLIGADIGSGALTADVLLARLQGQHIPGLLLAALFDRLPNEPTWQQAHILAAGRHKAERRSAVAHGITKAHQLPHGDIGSIFARRRQHAQ